MDPANYATISSDIFHLNSALSKVFVGPTDPLIQISTSSKLPKFRTSKEKSSQVLPAPSSLRQPIRKVLSEQRARKTIGNPTSKFGVDVVKSKYQLPGVVSNKGRQLGAVVYKKPKAFKQFKAQVLPKEIRENPLADPVDISEEDLSSGILRLIQRGVIPKAVDLSPAFARGVKPVDVKVANFHDWRDMAPPPPPPIIGPSLLQLERLSLPENGSIIPASNPYENKSLVLAKEETRTYEEIVDSFSGHQIIFRKGKILQTPEFQSFKRVYSETWGNLSQALSFAEDVFTRINAPIVYLDGKKLVHFVKDELRPLKLDDLLSSVINSSTVIPLMNSASHRYKNPLGKNLAAVKIQALWKGFKDYSAYKQLKVLIRKSVIIQKSIKNWKRKAMTMKIIQAKTEETLKKHRILQENFKKDYESYKNSKRVEVHIFNTCEDVSSVIHPEVVQSSQINRLFLLRNNLLDLILVTPRVVPEEIKNYYFRILEIGGVGSPKTRVTFIHPDILDKHVLFKRTSSLLYFSHNTCQKIKQLTLSRKSYLVCSKLSIFDAKLSVILSLPIFSGDFETCWKYSNRSELKILFQEAGLTSPLWETHLRNAEDFFQKLSELIYHNPDVDIWLAKMNREESSRGVAFIDVSRLRSVTEVRKKSNLKQTCEIHDLLEELKTSWNSIIKYSVPSLYPTWRTFIEKFTKYGGVIQATPAVKKSEISYPCIAFVVEPDGTANFIGTGDYLHSVDFLNAGAFFPQLSIAHDDAILITNQLAQRLFRSGLFGFFTLQLVAFVSNSSFKPVCWAVDLSFGICKLTCAYFYFHFIVGGLFDSTTGKYFMNCQDDDEEEEKQLKLGEANIYLSKESIRKAESPEIWVKVPQQYLGDDQKFHDFNVYDTREFLICWEMFNPSFVTLDIKNFFHMCRFEGVSYDLEHGRGITFILYDLLKFGYLGCMCISSKRENIMKLISQVFDFLIEHVGPPPVFLQEFEKKEYKPISDLVAKIKFIEKKMKPAKRNLDE
jgi:hypothetical protein